MTEETKKLALETFNTYTEDERFVAKFGMFPAQKTPMTGGVEETRLLAVALMKLANGEAL